VWQSFQFEVLLEVVYHGPAPASQVSALMAEFDSNKDGRVSWEEFREGLKALKGCKVYEFSVSARAVTLSLLCGGNGCLVFLFPQPAWKQGALAAWLTRSQLLTYVKHGEDTCVKQKAPEIGWQCR
jgi:hypothetical protein